MLQGHLDFHPLGELMLLHHKYPIGHGAILKVMKIQPKEKISTPAHQPTLTAPFSLCIAPIVLMYPN